MKKLTLAMLLLICVGVALPLKAQILSRVL